MRIYSTRRRGSVVGLAAPVVDLAALRKLSTTGIIDKTIIYVESEKSTYAFDRQATDAESAPEIIQPTSTGGRWFQTYGAAAAPSLHVHNKYADVSAVVGPNQVVISHEEFEIEDGITVELLDNSDLLIL
jgi:hypothetical protein